MAARDVLTGQLLVQADVAALARCGDRTVDRAVAAGLLPIYARRGGNGVRLFRREDAERWIRGETAPAPTTAPTPPRRARTTDASTASALDRIAATARGPR